MGFCFFIYVPGNVCTGHMVGTVNFVNQQVRSLLSKALGGHKKARGLKCVKELIVPE